MIELDHYDQGILRILRSDEKMGNQELVKKVNLSSSPCWRRIKKFEDSGNF